MELQKIGTILIKSEVEALCPELAWHDCEWHLDRIRVPDKVVYLLVQARQQLAEREAEVIEAISIVKAMSPKHAITCPANIGSKVCKCDSNATNEWINGQLGDLPAKAEAHDAKVWNEAIKECIKAVSDNILPGSVDDSIRYSTQAMQDLLKPESEVK